MLARDLAEAFPSVGLDDDALTAARLLAEQRLPGLVVLGDDGLPTAILGGSQVLRFALPGYLLDDPSLAHVYAESAADALVPRLARRRVRDTLPLERPELPVVPGQDTALEVAVLLARLHSPIAAVVEGERLVGVVTVARVLNVLLPKE